MQFQYTLTNYTAKQKSKIKEIDNNNNNNKSKNIIFRFNNNYLGCFLFP